MRGNTKWTGIPMVLGLGILAFGMLGNDSGGCLPAQTPSMNSECSAPAECEGLPHVLCDGDWQCASGRCIWRCEIVELECTEASDCEGRPHIECVGAFECLAGACSWKCGVTPDECVIDSDCPDGQFCEIRAVCPDCVYSDPPCLAPCSMEGICTPLPTGCHSDDDCADGQHCSVSDGDCGTDPTCPMCAVCYGKCVPDSTACVASGCSGEICASEPLDSPCIWLEWFRCLRLTECGNFGPDGSCGFAQTEDFLACLNGIGCSSDRDCPPDHRCVEKVDCPPCVYEDPPCRVACQVRNVCEPRGEPLRCQGNEDCPDGQRCDWGWGCPPCECDPAASEECACPMCMPPQFGICVPEGCVDMDGDGWCNDLDCDDRDPAVHPLALEICDGRDNDCNGIVDDGCESGCMSDADCPRDHFCVLPQAYGPDGALLCCPPNARCTPDVPPCGPGECRPRQAQQCLTDSDCGEGHYCELMSWFGQDGQMICCPPNALCSPVIPPCEGGECRLLPDRCWTDIDCGNGRRCEGAVICPPGAYCFAPDRPGECVDMSPKCFSNSDCQAGEVCVLPDRDDPSRQCCLPDELCLMIYPVCEGVCALPKGVCWTDADCPRGEFCNILRCDPGQRCAGPYECRPYNQ